MESVVVLMSTYNGEKYLKEQIKSILNQQNINVSLVIRDDGSTDGTRKILNDFKKKSNIKVIFGDNVGWKSSFFNLLYKVKFNKNEFYAFSDQDDIWKPKKLLVACSKLRKRTPMVYHSNVELVDSEKKTIGYRFDKNFRPEMKFPQNFLDGFGVGATMVFNSAMLQLIQGYKITMPTNHDAFVIALGYLLGEVFYDKNSYILYRRHSKTATGFNNSKRISNPSILMRYRRYKRGPKCNFSIRAEQLINGYSLLISQKERKILKFFSEYRTNWLVKLYLLTNPVIKATGVRKTLQVKYRIFFNTL